MLPLLILISSLLPNFSSGIYEQSVTTLDDSTVNFSSSRGKKILVAEFNAMQIDTAQLQNLDSLQRANDSLIVIAIPSHGVGVTVNKSKLVMLRTKLKLSYIIGTPVVAKKGAGVQQNAVFKWLTNVSENSHFDQDVGPLSQMFFINEQGVLYAVLGKDAPRSIISEVLSGK